MEDIPTVGLYDEFDFVGSNGNPNDWNETTLIETSQGRTISQAQHIAGSFNQNQNDVDGIDLSTRQFHPLPLDYTELSKKQQQSQTSKQQHEEENKQKRRDPPTLDSIPVPLNFEDPLQSNYYTYPPNTFNPYNINSTSSLSRIDSLAPTLDFSSEEEDDSQSTRHVLTSDNIERSRNNRSSKDYHKGNNLGRRITLNVAVNAFRRASLRVVNLAGTGGEDLVRDDVSPSGKKHPHTRLEDQEDGVISDSEEILPVEEDDEEFDLGELRGKTLGIFGPTSWLRIISARGLHWRWTEPIILLCILLSVIFLTIQSSPNVYLYPRPISNYFHSWEDYALFSIFVIFTLEILSRIIVTGFIINPIMNPVHPKTSGHSKSGSGTIDTEVKSGGLKGGLKEFKIKFSHTGYPPLPRTDSTLSSKSQLYPPTSFNNDRTDSTLSKNSLYPLVNSRRAQNISTATTSTLTSLISNSSATPFALSIRKQRTTYQQAFLRHSWNRVDFLAVISFWISFALAMSGVEAGSNIYIFRALAVLRSTRLLAVTSGTTTILQSLKKATPQLANVALFVIFAMTLFSIIGVQSFQQSYRRNCVWIDPENILANVSIASQHCGGYINSTLGTAVGYIVNATGLSATEGPKGYICPISSLCMETQNPDNGALSFDNVFASLLQIVVIASANTWTSIMFNMMDSDYFSSSIFFIVVLIVLNFWLINLFVAVITSTFAGIMEESKHSAFSTSTLDALGTPAISDQRGFTRGHTMIRDIYRRTHLVWVALILVDIAFQASRRFNMSASWGTLLDQLEFYFTIALDVEMIIRVFGLLPDWRIVFSEGENLMDLSLAFITSLIQLPIIKHSSAYPWLTAFQIARFYRVIIAIPRIRRLLVRVLGTFKGLLNMILFLMLSNFIGALIAVQLFRGIPQPEIDETAYMTFFQIFNSFLAMYQILTSENWTDVLNNVLTNQTGQFQIAVSAIFLSLWMLFSYFILISMFIAVLNENFTIAEELKHKQQMEAYLLPKTEITVSWLRNFNPYTFFTPKSKKVHSETLARELSDEKLEMELNRGTASPGEIQLHEHDQDAFITAHPSYDLSLWIFTQNNPVRRFCQCLVDPAFGSKRLRGRPAIKRYKFIFQSIMLIAIIGSVVIAAVATPVYRRNYFLRHGTIRLTWFNLTEVSLGFVFVLEFLVKIIADGFVFSPNAYLLSIWNDLDFLILITLVINIITALVAGGKISRLTRSLKAFRALRFINLSSNLRETFYNILIVGAVTLLDASALAVLYIIPFAVWGQNIFSGSLYFCNDPSIATKAACAGEYLNSAISTWTYVSPRIWTNPYVWSFDSFQQAFTILFEIISLEGWIAVMESAMQITGPGLQPIQNASQFNSLYFVFFNLIGGVFILTLFVSVILENFHRRSGMALLTSQQRHWAQLRKIILRQRPAKNPHFKPTSRFRSWCFERAIQKHGWYSKVFTGLYLFHIVVLCTDSTTNPDWADRARNFVFLALTVVYSLDIVIRSSGLSLKYFVRNGWNLYDVMTTIPLLATTIALLLDSSNQALLQVQKLFVVAISFKLVQKNNSLNELFKTAAASLPAILNIFGLWLVFFFVWAIAYLEIFGLTKWGVYGTNLANYSAFWNVMIMLVLASTGEGWNGFMHDSTVEFPNCTQNPNFLLSDCGSIAFAYTLFVSWNILSQYLMSNLILGAVVENFSYVFQSDGATSLDREQMRSFKKIWAAFDLDRTGFIRTKDIVPFLARLTGIFEVRIYREEWSINKIEAMAAPPPGKELGSFVYGKRCHGKNQVDVSRISRSLRVVDFDEVKARKRTYNRLYHEAMLEADSEKGISFTQMLLLLGHYKLIENDQALKVEEQIERKSKLEKVMELVHKDRVESALMSIILRRRYRFIRDTARQASSLSIPEIFVDSDNYQYESSLKGKNSRSFKLDTSFQDNPSSYSTPPNESPPKSPSNLSPVDGYFGRASSSSTRESSPTRRRSISADDGDFFVNQF